MADVFKPESELSGKEIISFGRRKGIYISDFDSYMPRGNPIVSFK